MAEYPFTAADLDALRQWDTPTICNALELVVPHRRGYGFTVRQLVAADPRLPPICGLARTGTIRAAAPSGRTAAVDRAARLGWYDYVAEAAMPTVVVLQDLDDTPGTGAFWGEVHTNVHKALGAQGVVTSGSIRDLDTSAAGFQLLAGMVNPSHAYVHIVQYGQEVSVHGMAAHHDAVVHADRHGAVVIPHDAVVRIPAAIDLCLRRERLILDACGSRDFTVEALKDALARADEIH
ncbi:RraA family protein [Roseomonas sp. BN140053]|uniref:RraA family protein n=1 Tax=Roseomonas sp. BN140053 TaxID=3391898 RepID=UPI0039E99D05